MASGLPRHTDRIERVGAKHERHLGPILKAADELVGKLRSLAQKDFKELTNRRFLEDVDKLPRHELLEIVGLMYLFANFWGRIAVLRRESVYANLAETKDGKKLISFMESFEARSIRIVDRQLQRLIGEALISPEGSRFDTMSLHDFAEAYVEDGSLREWLRPLRAVLLTTQHTRIRQRVLLYGVVVHALIDTLDPRHNVTRERPSYPNKLSQRTRRDLRFKVIEQYLPFIRNREKYLGIRDYWLDGLILANKKTARTVLPLRGATHWLGGIMRLRHPSIHD